ncbi:MAG: hypothetical protein ACRELE_00935 [Gemmatimonadales bacterium]
MTGHVFHPGHDALHGVTVVITGSSGQTYVGRWHEMSPRGIALRDVAIHDPRSNPVPVDAWLARQRKFGVATTHKQLIVADDEVRGTQLFDPV